MKKILILILASMAISLVYVIVSFKYELRYPKNEHHSRIDCEQQLKQIAFLLHVYIEKKSVFPVDLYEIISPSDYKDKRLLICPSRFTITDKAGFLKDNSPVYVSSYRLLVPRQVFDKLSDGTIVVKEFEGNHPESSIGKINYSSGYHVIIKDNNDLKVQFVNTERK